MLYNFYIFKRLIYYFHIKIKEKIETNYKLQFI